MINELIEVVEHGGNIGLYRDELLKVLRSLQAEPVKVEITSEKPEEVTATLAKPVGKVTITEKAKAVVKKIKK